MCFRASKGSKSLHENQVPLSPDQSRSGVPLSSALLWVSGTPPKSRISLRLTVLNFTNTPQITSNALSLFQRPFLVVGSWSCDVFSRL